MEAAIFEPHFFQVPIMKKLFSLVKLSYITLIIRRAKELRIEEEKQVFLS